MSVKKTINWSAPRRLLYRRRDTCRVLSCSLNMVKKLEDSGRLRKIRLGKRDIHHDAEEVEALARGE